MKSKDSMAENFAKYNSGNESYFKDLDSIIPYTAADANAAIQYARKNAASLGNIL